MKPLYTLLICVSCTLFGITALSAQSLVAPISLIQGTESSSLTRLFASVLLPDNRLAKGIMLTDARQPNICMCNCGSKKPEDQPLYVVDGLLIPSDSLRKINPQLIQTLVVLDRRKALRRYGSQAKNGVIVITLKTLKVSTLATSN